MSEKLLQILNIVGFIAVIATNALANALPIAGRTTGEVSDLYPNLFTPAGITFSIWGIIYLALLVFIVLQSRGLFSRRPAPEYVVSIGPFFFINCLLNVGWILVWHHLLVILSVFIMLGLLGTLLVIYRRLQGYSWRGFGLIRLPFSLYFAWICVATIANVTVLLVDAGYRGAPLDPSVWTSILVGIAAVLGGFFLFREEDPVFPLVIIWALIGIILKLRVSFDWTFAPIIVALIGIGVLVVGDLWRVVQHFSQRSSRTSN
ncbi:MAG TPA: TspO/MBR family protein [Saprospiraceae bacterium]|nr:TspO/MBR family protein [Saprospiraceae bacterium]